MVIRAEADRDRELILAAAYRDAEILRGKGDAEAAGIYGDAYRQDPALYRFLRTLESYESISTTRRRSSCRRTPSSSDC